MVAQYADACNIFDLGPDGLKAKFDVIRGHCGTVGRDYADIEQVIIGLAGVHEEAAFEKVPDLVAQLNAL